MKLFDPTPDSQRSTVFSVDKKIRRAAHLLAEKVTQQYDVFKIVIFGDNLNTSNIAGCQANVAVILSGVPKKVLFDADANIMQYGHEVRALLGVSFNTTMIFQSEYEVPILCSRPTLVKKIKSEGIAIHCMSKH